MTATTAASSTARSTTNRGFTEVEPATLKSWLDRGEAIAVDVREPDEHARERLPGARLMPLSRFDPSSLPQAAEGSRLVLHCRSGRRSAEACARALAAGRTEVFNLAGGLEGWKAAGLSTQTDARMPISIMRQVQLVIGAMVLLGSVLAAVVSPWFLLLTGFFGAGLLFAGATGTCGLASVIGLMPWNRAFRDAGCSTGSCSS